MFFPPLYHITIDACAEGFKQPEEFGFKIGKIGFGGTHAHAAMDAPKKYSVQIAIGMLKSRAAQNIFDKKSNFRKRYPRKWTFSESPLMLQIKSILYLQQEMNFGQNMNTMNRLAKTQIL